MKHNVKQRYVAGLRAAQFDVRLNVRESRAEHVRLSTLCFPAAKISTDAALILHKLVLLEKKNFRPPDLDEIRMSRFARKLL